MINREFLQLAHTYDSEKHRIAGMFMSEKLDGQRCFWDGGISRGKPASEVPYANVEKHGRFVNTQYATGLWSRYGQPIHAPDHFLDQLPRNVCLDGELYMGRGAFQDLGFVRSQDPTDLRWQDVEYLVFDSPAYSSVFQPGRINNTNFKKIFDEQVTKFLPGIDTPVLFQFTQFPELTKQVRVHTQRRLPFTEQEARDEMLNFLETVTSNGGEGIMLRSASSVWTPKRTTNLLKVKKFVDSEGTVIGCTSGRLTDKGSKLLGKMGALILKWKNPDGKDVTFELSGFTDDEREISDPRLAEASPGMLMPPDVYAKKFPLGTAVTFRYRELTDDGKPKEARYWRKADVSV